jgi:periplasmic protein TonB
MPRTLLHLGNIEAVPRRSPPRVRKRTPWRPQPDGTATARTGEREWFSERLFVESRDGHGRGGYGASVVVHLVVVAALAAFLLTRPIHSIVVRMESLAMPAFASPPPEAQLLDAPAMPKPAPRQPHAEPTLPAPAAPPALGTSVPAPAPLEAPPDFTPETGAEATKVGDESGVAGGIVGGIAGGLPGGAAGGVVGGVVGGTGLAQAGQAGPLVVRAGAAFKAPRKIRDAKPVYPAGALPLRAQGAVLIEAVIGPDGRVQDARVLHSVVPLLDQAALDAVRQWAYEPSVLNGEAVSVIMTVVVNFALQ